jgi:hypothetical protein
MTHPEKPLSGASTEIVAPGAGAHLVEAQRARLPALIETGDTQGLDDLRLRLWWAQKEAQHRKLTETANELARLRIECEAGMGEIELRAGTAWVEGGEPRPARATRFRRAAILADRGKLHEILDTLECADDITDKALAREVARQGLAYVPLSAFQREIKRFLDAKAPQGFCQCGCGQRTPISKDGREGRVKGEPAICMPSHTRPSVRALAVKAGIQVNDLAHKSRLNWWSAKKLAVCLGIDPLTLPSAPSKMTMGRRRWDKPKQTGGKWDEFLSLNFKQGQQLQALVGSNPSHPAHKVAWENLFALRDYGLRQANRKPAS